MTWSSGWTHIRTWRLPAPMLEDENGVASTRVALAFPSLRWTLGEMLRVHKLMSARMRSERLMGAYWNGEPGEVDWVPFAAAMVRREAVDSVGKLSEELFMYGEDLEWCWRLRQAGWLVAVTGEVTFVHTGGTSAVATWGEVGRFERIVAGFAAALRLMHGPLWTRLYAGARALALFLEGVDPRRDASQRAMNRFHARRWLRQAVLRHREQDRRHPERAALAQRR